MDVVRQSGIEVVGAVPWGTHFCQFYETRQDLVETLVPYFREGLVANEFCMWVTSPPLQVEEAKAALRAAVPDLDDYIARGQIEILDHSDWYTRSGRFNADEVLQGWVDKHDEALRRGYEGLRLMGNTFWLEQTDWDDFVRYEETVNNVIGQHRMLAICTYSLERCGAQEIAEVIATHQFALIKRSGRWQIIESSRHRLTEAALRESEERLRRTFESITDNFVAVDREWRYTYVNDSALANLRKTREELIGKSMWEVFPEAVGTVFWDKYHEAVEKQTPVEFEAYYEPYDIWDQVRAYPSQDGLTLYYRDITERKRAEEAALRAKEDWERTFDAVPDLIAVIDGHHRIVRANRAMAQRLGAPPNECAGKVCYEVVHGLTCPPKFCPHVRTLADGREHTAEVHEPRLGGVFTVSTTPFTDEQGQRLGSVHVARDITERKKIEDALAEQKAFLQSERDLLQTIMENTEAHLAYLDRDFNFIMVNSTYARGSGHSVDDLIGKNHFDLFPNPENQAIFEKVRDTGERVQYLAKPFVFEDQPWRGVTYWDWTLVPVKDSAGRVRGLVLSLMDVTEQKRSEETLRQHREDLNHAQAVARTGSWRLDVRRNELRWSDETYRMFRIAPGTSLTYESFLSTIHPEDREYVDRKWTAALGGQPYDIEHRIVVGGTVKWVRERAELEFDEDGTLLGGFGTVQDITERKQAEEAVERERQRLQTLVDTSPVGILLVGADARLLLVNREAERLLGAPVRVGDSLEQYSRAAVRRRPDSSAYAQGELPVERALSHGETVRAEEMHFHRQDGSVLPVLVNAVPLYGAGSEIIGAIAVQQDITPLEELERLRNEFLGIVSHELRTPLTAIKGSAATVLGSSSPFTAGQTRELFQIIDEQADRLSDLIGDLLDMTRIEAGTLSIEAEPTDLREIVREARESFVRGVCLQEVRLELPDDLPLVRADRRRIGQVMTNLLSNAAKFSPPAALIAIFVEHEPFYVTVRVPDEGHGIAEEDLPKLFKKYSRPHEKSGLTLGGSGLGLAICKGIVEAHGGRIWAESAGEGQGATFSFTLPVAAGEAAAPVGETAVATRLSRPGQRTRILAVDDEIHVLRYLQRLLSEAGYEPVLAADASEVNRLVELTGTPSLCLPHPPTASHRSHSLDSRRALKESPLAL